MANKRCRLKVVSLLSSRVLVPLEYTDKVSGKPMLFVPVILRHLDAKSVVVCLVEKVTDGSLPQACAGEVLKSTGLNFTVGIKGIQEFKGSKEFWLFIGEVGLKEGNHWVAIEVTLTREKPESKGRAIPVQAPLTNATVSPTFSAYGTYAGAAALEAKLTRGNQVYLGTDVVGVPSGTWMFDFTNIPENTEYGFTIAEKVGGGSGSTNNVTVDAAKGEPIEGQVPPGPP